MRAKRTGKKKKMSVEPTERVERPPLYPHAPRHQMDFLEKIIESKNFDPLKSHQFEGAIHLGFVVLTLLILKYTYINFDKYGFVLLKDTNYLLCILYEVIYMFIYDLIDFILSLFNFILYKIFVNKYISKRVLLFLHFMFQISFILISFWIRWDTPPIPSLISIMTNFIYVLKMYSYIATNLLLHEKVTKKYEEIIGTAKLTSHTSFANRNVKLQAQIPDTESYPSNINIGNYIYFIYFTPSLVYETKFIRTQNIRVSYVIKELLALAFCACGMVTILSQFILPVIYAASPVDAWTQTIRDIFAVTVPSLFIWLLCIYAYFHCWLNAKSELIYFANREFYKDWWNADSIGAFWRRWNLPVHEWCLRHLYIDSMYYFQASKDVATIIVFVFSAIMHEVFFCYAFKGYQPYFLYVMLAQIPLLYLNRVKSSRRVGNVIMWISLMIGQPLLEILYLRNWFKTRYNNQYSFWCR